MQMGLLPAMLAVVYVIQTINTLMMGFASRDTVMARWHRVGSNDIVVDDILFYYIDYR